MSESKEQDRCHLCFKASDLKICKECEPMYLHFKEIVEDHILGRSLFDISKKHRVEAPAHPITFKLGKQKRKFMTKNQWRALLKKYRQKKT